MSMSKWWQTFNLKGIYIFNGHSYVVQQETNVLHILGLLKVHYMYQTLKNHSSEKIHKQCSAHDVVPPTGFF